MPQYTQLKHGTPFWADLVTRDIAGSMSFYTDLFGWGYEEASPEQMGGQRYAWAKSPSGYPAGIAELDDAEDSASNGLGWSVQLIVDDMEDAVKGVADFGGQVLRHPSTVGEYGIGAEISDSTGARTRIWQALVSGPVIKHEHGAMQWCELMTSNPSTTAAFLSSTLHLKTERMSRAGNADLYMLSTADGPAMSISAIGELSDRLVEQMAGAQWIVYFNVDDVDAAVQRAVENGAELPDPAWDVPGIGRIAWIYDPQGALLGLIAPENP